MPLGPLGVTDSVSNLPWVETTFARFYVLQNIEFLNRLNQTSLYTISHADFFKKYDYGSHTFEYRTGGMNPLGVSPERGV